MAFPDLRPQQNNVNSSMNISPFSTQNPLSAATGKPRKMASEAGLEVLNSGVKFSVLH